MSHSPDAQLVQRLKDGDLTAFDALFVKYYKMLCVNAYWFLQNDQEAKDLVQTFFMDIWDRKLYLRFNEDDIKGYLHMAVKNRCLNLLKQQKMQSVHHEAFTHLRQDDAEAPDYYNRLHASLKDMSGHKRMAVQMVYIQGKRYQEAAEEMGISINSLKTHLKRGLQFLRQAVHKIKE